MLSLYLPSPHAALYDRGEFISCIGSVPSPMTLALRRKPNGSALPKFPSSVSDGGWFRGFTGSLLRCGLSSCSPPCTDLTRDFSRPTGTFTPELPASRSPFSSSGITTVATERFHRWDFHPLERQLASLHGLFHPLQHAGLSRRSPDCPSSARSRCGEATALPQKESVYLSFAYSALAWMRIGMSGSASFQSVRKSV